MLKPQLLKSIAVDSASRATPALVLSSIFISVIWRFSFLTFELGWVFKYLFFVLNQSFLLYFDISGFEQGFKGFKGWRLRCATVTESFYIASVSEKKNPSLDGSPTTKLYVEENDDWLLVYHFGYKCPLHEMEHIVWKKW